MLQDSTKALLLVLLHDCAIHSTSLITLIACRCSRGEVQSEHWQHVCCCVRTEPKGDMHANARGESPHKMCCRLASSTEAPPAVVVYVAPAWGSIVRSYCTQANRITLCQARSLPGRLPSTHRRPDRMPSVLCGRAPTRARRSRVCPVRCWPPFKRRLAAMQHLRRALLPPVRRIAPISVHHMRYDPGR